MIQPIDKQRYKPIIKTFVFFVFLFVFIQLPSFVQAQDGFKNLINKQIEDARKKDSLTEQEPISEKPTVLPDSTQALQDSLSLEDSLAVDMAKAMNMEAETNKSIDTSSFIKRALAVKERKPSKPYVTEAQWDNYFAINRDNQYKKEHVLDKDFNVLGWHPYWMGSAYKSYNFSLLSAIAYFSYELNPNTGGYYTIHDWKTTSLIDSAHQHKTKVLLSVTNFGFRNNDIFLSNFDAQQNFIKTLISLLKERNADGVNIDFESISGSKRTELTNFIIDLSNNLKKEDKEYKITLALPPIDHTYVYDFEQLNKYVDLYIIMGYEFYGVNSPDAGPVSPLASGDVWYDYNLQRALDEYLVEKAPAKKLLMGLPYYGAEWQTESLKFPSKSKKFIKYPMYRNIRKSHGELPCCEDEVSKSKYYVYRDKSNSYRQLWYEDSLSLSKKYDWIKESEIGGVGIWALGYDNGYDELWKLLAAKFALSPDEAKKENAKSFLGRFSPRRLMYLGLRIMKNPAYLVKNPRPLLGLFGAISGISLIGFYFLFRFGHRIKRSFNIALKGGVALLIIILIALIFLGMKYTGTQEIFFLIIGFLIGAIIIFFLSRRFLSEKDLP